MINSAEKITPGTINILLEINQNLAPGSGTDGIILICDSTSVHVRTDAGKK